VKAEVDLRFLRWGCKKGKKIIKITTERQAEVTKKIAKENKQACAGEGGQTVLNNGKMP